MVQITVDLSADKATLARVAQLILQFAGYEPPRAEVPAPVVDPVNDSHSPGFVTHPLLQPVDEPQITRTFVNPMGHGSRELDVDAAKLTAMGADPGPTLNDIDPQQAFGSLAAPVYAPPAPPAAVIPPPPPPAGIDVDARGLPWDARIHASTRAKTADGNWRQKRGTDPQEVIRVEAELRQTMSLPAPAAPPVPPVPAAPPAPPAPVVPPVPFAGNAAPPAPPVSTSAPVASPGAAPSASPGSGPAPTFPQLMGAITKAFTAGTLPKATIDAAIAKVGLSALPMLASRPDLVGPVASELGIAL